VDAAHRRRGLGRAFVVEAERYARERGLRALQWEAQTDNRNAIEFALANGFRIAGFHDALYRNDDLPRKEAQHFRGIALFLTKPIDR
jgi:ribosomal protein S18 acetylase RimI-like enzyme